MDSLGMFFVSKLSLGTDFFGTIPSLGKFDGILLVYLLQTWCDFLTRIVTGQVLILGYPDGIAFSRGPEDELLESPPLVTASAGYPEITFGSR